MKTNIVSIMAACFCSISFCAKPADAALITIQIEAVVDSVQDEGNYLEGKIGVGDIIKGFYTYESSTSDTNPSSYVGDYEHFLSPCGIFLSVGGFDFQTDLTNVYFLAEIINDSISGGLHDGYIVISYSNVPLSSGVPVDYISWLLRDSTGVALSSDALPTTAPVLNDWRTNRLRLEADRRYLVDAHVTSAIPEPAMMILLGIGGLFLRKRS